MVARNISEMLNDKTELDKIGAKYSRHLSRPMNWIVREPARCSFTSSFAQLCDKYMIYRRGANEHCGLWFFFFSHFWLDLRTKQKPEIQALALFAMHPIAFHFHCMNSYGLIVVDAGGWIKKSKNLAFIFALKAD